MNFTRNGESRVALKSNYLRKGQGNGGSSTKFEVGFRDPSSGRGYKLPKGGIESPSRGSLIPMMRPDPEKTTVRIRTKNNGFQYGKASLYGNNKFGDQMDYEQEQSQHMLWEMKRQNQEKIQKYKENKLQKQIEKIEAEQKALADVA